MSNRVKNSMDELEVEANYDEFEQDEGCICLRFNVMWHLIVLCIIDLADSYSYQITQVMVDRYYLKHCRQFV